MADKVEDANKDKILKLARVLKELEEKYKKVNKDRTALLAFLKSIFPASGDVETLLEAGAGLVDGEKLLAVYKQLENNKAKTSDSLERASKKIAEENELLKVAERSLKQKVTELEGKTGKLETELQTQTKKLVELQKQAKQQANDGASVLLAKLKNVGLSNPSSDPYHAEFQHDKQLLELKVREQADKILSLKSLLNDAQKPLKQNVVMSKTKVKNQETQTGSGEMTEGKADAENMQKELSEARRKLGEAQLEYSANRKKAQMLLAEKDSEILKLTESIRRLKRLIKIPDKSKATDSNGLASVSGKLNVTAGTAASSSVASLGGDDRAVIAQLEQRVKELTEVITLQSYSEQTLTKKLQHFEMSRSKGDINGEYIKNIFLKYLIFNEHGEKLEASRMETILLDLLHVSKMEKEGLEKTRTSKSFLWSIFYRSADKEDVLSSLNASFVFPSSKLLHGRTESFLDSRKKANTEMSMDQNAPDFENEMDFAGVAADGRPLNMKQILIDAISM